MCGSAVLNKACGNLLANLNYLRLVESLIVLCFMPT
jgi:hypothetical protein